MKKIKNLEIFDYDGSFSYCSIPYEVLSLIDSDSDYCIFPGFCDVHVHFREPGFSYKETIKTGSMAAAHGGYTSVCTMPNLSPVPDSLSSLAEQLDIIKRDSVINIYPYGSITKERRGIELSEMDKISGKVVAFSDDGSGISTAELMLKAMTCAKKLNKIIAAHCEDMTLVNGGYINQCGYSVKHGHLGICNESEYKQIERDILLAKETGCKYHVCHISCKESVDLIRKAKKEGVDISCETAPHYLLLDDSFLEENGRFKMNPPLRDLSDRLALIEGIKDGTIDMIATDHAPHSFEEKSKGLKNSAFGIVGIENSFQLLYSFLVKNDIISLEKLIELMSVNPRKRFGLSIGNEFCIWNLNKKSKIDSSGFLSKGKSTPFDGYEVFGQCLYTVINNKVVYKGN